MNHAQALQYAYLKRAHDKLGAVLEQLPKDGFAEHEYMEFYDAMQYVNGFEDAACEMLEQQFSECGLNEDGWPVDNAGYALIDSGYNRAVERSYTMLPPIKIGE